MDGLRVFADELRREVADRQEAGLSDGSAIYSETIFTEIVMEQLTAAGIVENPVVCHYNGPYGRSEAKLNGYAFNDDSSRLDLFVTVYADSPEPTMISRDEIAKAARQALQFFQASFAGHHKHMEPSGDAHDLARTIHESRQQIDRLVVQVITNCTTATSKLTPAAAGSLELRVDIWDLERLFRSSQANTSRDEIEIDLVALTGAPLPCLAIPKNNADYEAYLAVLPGNLLYRLYDEYGPRLLELNVRSFLGVRGSKTVNSGIRKTLKDEPDRFLAYNNGIVLTADHVDLTNLADGGQAIQSLRGLQIVNGGQTTASIHRAHKHDKTDISTVGVPAKITVIAPQKLDAMVQMISHYANSQNVVHPADFSANHPFHVRTEELARSTPCPDGAGRWFYERARGSYQVAQTREGSSAAQRKKFRDMYPPHRKFTKPELAKYLNAWDQLPHRVSSGSQKNFDFFMQHLHHTLPDFIPDAAWFKQFVAKLVLFRAAQRVVRQQKFPAYQANITVYLVAAVAWHTGGKLDVERIWRSQNISSGLETLLRSWSADIDRSLRETARGRMVSEWAKKEDCWLEMSRLTLPLPTQLPLEWPR